MSKRTLTIEGFHKGQFISWFMTTQAANKITVKLYDDSKVYVDQSRQSTSIAPPLAEGHSFLEGNNLKLDITAEPNSKEILAWFNNMNISSATTAKTVGNFFVLAGEDQPGGDEDYNDVCISITGWNKKG